MLKNIKGIHVTVGGILAVPAVIAAVYGSASAMGFYLDRPAWSSDMKTIAGAFESVQRQLDKHEILDLQDRADDLELKIEREKFAGRRPDPEDVLKLRQIQRKISDRKAVLGDHQ